MKFLFALSVFTSVVFLLHAQDFYTQKYDWDANPKQTILPDSDLKEQKIGLKDKRILEFIYSKDKNPILLLYYTVHKIIKVNTAEGIEQTNKIYIPITNAFQTVSIKVRSISPAGKVIQLSPNDIKDATSMDDDQGSTGDYKYFAMQGLEPGSEIEYIYTVEFKGTIYGDEIFQSGFPEKDVECDIYAPPNLIFLTNSYNGLSDMITDTALQPEHHLYLREDRIPALKKENYSSYTSNCARLEYTLGYNTVVGINKRVYDWAEASQAYFPSLTTFDTKTLSDVSDYLKKIDLNNGSSKQKLFAIDNYLKTHIAVKEDDNPDFSDVKKILTSNLANKTGIMRVYLAFLNVLNLNSQIVLTSDHEIKRFDGNFESWNFLNDYLIYLPSLNVYLAPTEFDSRNGLPPYQWTDNEGLFIRKVSVGDYTNGLGTVKNIPAVESRLSHDDIYEDLSFNDSLNAINAHVKRIFCGYCAEFIQPDFDFITDDNRKKLFDLILKFMGDDSKYTNVSAQNNLNDTSETHPITFEADISIASLIENAGSKYLFKIGEVIGQQDELYNTDKRENPIENDYNRGYYRELNFTIPNGCTIDNTNALSMNVSMPDSSCFFKSSFAIEGNKLKIILNERYDRIRYSVSEYPAFQKVINASADWNKIVLILEKKS